MKPTDKQKKAFMRADRIPHGGFWAETKRELNGVDGRHMTRFRNVTLCVLSQLPAGKGFQRMTAGSCTPAEIVSMQISAR